VADDGILRVPETDTPPPSKVIFLPLGILTAPLHPLPVHVTVEPELALASAVWTVAAELQLTTVVAAHVGLQRQTLNKSAKNNVLIFMALSLQGVKD
jgi:hypothetical protein